ncbi:MAG: hypothetical protein Q4E36_01605 [Bacillota bacterium]|nr:hypothetical protein [Bacillota bacterium]
MKRKFLLVLSLVLGLSLILMACSKEGQDSQANLNQVKLEESAFRQEIEARLAEEAEWNIKKDFAVVAGTRQVAEVLKDLGYDNVVAVPEDSLDLFPDAKSIGDSKDPDFSDLKYSEVDLFISDSAEEYLSVVEKEHSNFYYNFYNFQEERVEDTIISIARSLGMENVAKEVYGL